MPKKGHISPSRFKDVMTKSTGSKSKNELKSELESLQNEQAKREEAGRTNTKVYRNTQKRIKELPMLINNWSLASTFGDTALSYADEVVMDIIGVETEDWTSNAVEHGNEHEWWAIQVYEEQRVVSVKQPGRIEHPEYDFISGEPDGLVGSEGIIEVKCPWNSKNHLGNLIEAEQLSIYQWQVQGYLWITGRNWCDFVSFDPRFPEKYQLSVNRVMRDDGMITELEDRCVEFWAIVQEKLEQIQLLSA